jgi:hypothetical protein
MANVKISDLPASTTPLVGSEVLPIVQSTSTVNVSVANLTAGRSVSAASIANGLGAAGTPAYTFTGDLNTGMWSPAADTLAFSEGGVEAMRITSAGNVGIGTSSPASKLDVNGDIRISDKLIHSGNAETSIRFPTTNTVTVETSSSERMRIDSTGNVGIGTSSPASKLDVNGDVTITDKIIHSGDPNTAIRFPSADNFTVETAGSERMRITEAGNVGIGTNSPGAKLHVIGDIRSTVSCIITGAGEMKTTLAGGGLALNSSDKIAFETAASERMRIDSAGDVGIGTTNPLFPLEVNGEVRAANFTTSSGSQSQASSIASTLLTLSGIAIRNYMVTVGISGYEISACSLIITGGNGAGGIQMREVELTTDAQISISISGGDINVTQTTGAPQTIFWSITRLM